MISEKQINRRYEELMTKMFGPKGERELDVVRVEELKNEYADLKGEHGEKTADKILADRLLAKYLG